MAASQIARYACELVANEYEKVVDFYGALFKGRGYKAEILQRSSYIATLKAEDDKYNTVASLSVERAFEKTDGFLMWSKDFSSK